MIIKIQKLLAVLAVSFAAVQATAHAQVVIGTGDAYDNIIIQADGFTSSPLWYQYHYNSADYGDPTDPFRGADLLIAIATDISGLSGTTNPITGLSATFAGNADAGFFLFSLTQNSDNPTMPPGNYFWTYFVSGGTVNEEDSFYDPITDEDGVPVVDPVPTGSWSLAPVGAAERYPGSGNWDAWVFGHWSDDYSTYEGPLPAIAPVPEPTTALYLGLALLLGTLRFYQRRKNSSR